MKTSVAVIGLFVVVLIFVTSLSFTPSLNQGECDSDEDCVPATCCHPTECVPISQKPDCSDIFCTQSCEGPMDCGAGQCICANGRCEVELLR